MAELSGDSPIIPGQGKGATGPETALVFVYGSLKLNQPNHHWLAGATGLGEASLAGVQLFDLGPFPMAVEIAGEMAGARAPAQLDGQSSLHGELYRVDGTILQRLDRLEGAPRLFERHWRCLSDGTNAWVYLGRAAQVRHAARIPSGHWEGPRLARWRRPEAMAGVPSSPARG